MSKRRKCTEAECTITTADESGLCHRHRPRPFCRFRRCPHRQTWRSKNYCIGHFRQIQHNRKRSPLDFSDYRRRPNDVSELQWFAGFISITDDHPLCWTWSGPTTPEGYPRFSISRKVVYGHRYVMAELAGVEVRNDWDVDHLCVNNTRCVNPAHLQHISKDTHNQVTQGRKKLFHGVAELPGVEGVAVLEWAPVPWAVLPSTEAFSFALEHGLPFRTEHVTRTVPSRPAPLIADETQRLKTALQERRRWLKAEGYTEATYSTKHTRKKV